MAKKYDDLQLKDDFMFGKVMQNENICKEFLEHLLGIKIESITYPERQKTLKITYDGKGVRLDLYVQDNHETIYDAEMQQEGSKKDIEQLPKRSRYYQGMIDLNLLEQGGSYQQLNESCIIFICTFDPFGRGLYEYTFESICKEDNSLTLNDGIKRIFFNTKGTKGEISDQAKAILDYIDKSTTEDIFTKELDNEVRKVRNNEGWRREYMKTLLHEQEIREEGREEGRKEGMQQGVQQGLQSGQAKQIIKISMEYNVETEKIVSKLITELNISRKQADEYLEEYGKSNN